MLGTRSPQPTLFDVGALNTIQLQPGSFYAQLAEAGPGLYPDTLFAKLYNQDRGRPSVPPSQLALLLLLQVHDHASDAEAIQHTVYDARWTAVLGTQLGTPLCAKSTLQLFRAKLLLHKQVRLLLKRSLDEALEKGLLKSGPLDALVDTMCVAGAGAVEDTWNLLSTGIWIIIKAVARAQGAPPADWADKHSLRRYVPDPHGSVKGSLEIQWEDATARDEALAVITVDGLRTLTLAAELARSVEDKLGKQLLAAMELLESLISQDVDVVEDDEKKKRVAIRQETEPDRIPSATDPEQRHGHKIRTMVDGESGMILDTEVIPGNAADAEEVLEQAQRIQKECGIGIESVTGDTAFGSGRTRADFEKADIELHARVAAEAQRGGPFPSSKFTIDLEAGTATCPAGPTTDVWHVAEDGGRTYQFGMLCDGCPLRDQCTKSTKGRTLKQCLQERLLRKARAAAATPEERARLRRRVKAEHRQARLAQLGAKRARYVGRARTEYQGLLAATIVNLRTIWNRTGIELRSSGSNRTPNSGIVGHQSANGTARAVFGSLWNLKQRLWTQILGWVVYRSPLRAIRVATI